MQKRSLLHYIFALDEIGQSLRYERITTVANNILDDSHDEDGPAPVIGQHWAKRFIKRYSELHKAKQKPMELERKLAHDPEMLSNWFERFQKLREQYQVLDDDIWNFDETGFRIGVGKSQ